MPYIIVKKGDQWCVEGPEKTHGCHDSRADAIKQQRALYKNAPPEAEAAVLPIPETISDIEDLASDSLLEEMIPHMTERIDESATSGATVTMASVKNGIPVRDIALLRLAVKRAEEKSEDEVEKAVTIAAGLADPEVAAQTVAVIGHLADRLRTAELNQAALVDVLQAVAVDSTDSRNALLEALSGITERLAEAPPINITVPVPEVNVNVEGGGMAGKRVVELERDPSGRLTGAVSATVPDPQERSVELQRGEDGKLIGATVGNRQIELQRDSAGNLVGAVVEQEEE